MIREVVVVGGCLSCRGFIGFCCMYSVSWPLFVFGRNYSDTDETYFLIVFLKCLVRWLKDSETVQVELPQSGTFCCQTGSEAVTARCSSGRCLPFQLPGRHSEGSLLHQYTKVSVETCQDLSPVSWAPEEEEFSRLGFYLCIFVSMVIFFLCLSTIRCVCVFRAGCFLTL